MKYFLTLKNLLIMALILNCRDNFTPGARAAKSDSLEKVILSQSFSEGTGGWALGLEFKTDKSYEFSYESEGEYWFNRGTYSFDETTVRLKPTFCGLHANSQPIPCHKTFNHGSCAIVSTGEDLEYSHHLRCIASDGSGDYNFSIRSHLLPNGTRRSHKGHSIKTIANRDGRTIRSCQLRKGPGTKYPIRLYVENEYEDDGSLKISTNKTIIVHGEYVNKKKTANKENKWYLITAGDTRYAWIEESCISL